MAASQVTISNDALAELRESAIQAFDGKSLQARECERVYPQALGELLEAHDWGWAIRRATLAAATNDRPNEWPFAYALPQGVAKPLRLIPADAPVFSGCIPGRGPWTDSFELDSGTIYSFVPGAILEYVAADVTPDQMPALFRRALSLTMAERMAITLRDKADLQKVVGDRANVAVQRAMAEDKNRQPNREWVGDVAAVRVGAYPGHAVPGWTAYPASTGY